MPLFGNLLIFLGDCVCYCHVTENIISAQSTLQPAVVSDSLFPIECIIIYPCPKDICQSLLCIYMITWILLYSTVFQYQYLFFIVFYSTAVMTKVHVLYLNNMSSKDSIWNLQEVFKLFNYRVQFVSTTQHQNRHQLAWSTLI